MLNTPPTITVETEAQLREIISDPGSRSKVIEGLEKHSINLIAHSPLVALSIQSVSGLAQVIVRGGVPGFVTVVDDYTLLIPDVPDHDEEDLELILTANPFAGLLFFMPGMKETLRINGRASLVSEAEWLAKLSPQAQPVSRAIKIEIEEVYMHCSKAIIRSKLWGTTTTATIPDSASFEALEQPLKLTQLDASIKRFIEAAPFLCLGTVMPTNEADLSPRGDPAGFVHILDDKTLLVPERPGNRLADSLRNVIASGTAGLLFMIPGLSQTLKITGKATVTTDPTLLEPLAVGGKLPLMAIRLEIAEISLATSHNLTISKLWSPETQLDRKAFPTLGQILLDQLQPRGILQGVSNEEIQGNLDRDAKQNLY